MLLNIKQNEPTDWLVVFLILDSLDIRDFEADLFKQVQTITLQKNNKVYFLKDDISRIINRDGNDHSYGLSIQELVYNEATNETSLVPVTPNGVDLNDGFAWRDALLQICQQTNARFSTLITWSHGAGIGIFNPETASIQDKPNTNTFNLIRNLKGLNRPLKKEKFICSTLQETDDIIAISKDVNCPGLDNLFISDIAHGLGTVTGKKPFDLMVMCNCYTQMIDNCYNLYPVTRYYLAPMTAIQVNGYDFVGFLKAVNDGIVPDANFKNIARLLIDGYKNLNPVLEKGAAIICNDLGAILNLKPLLNSICKFFDDNFNAVFPVIDKVLTPDIAFCEKDFVDLILFFDTIQAELHSDEYDGLYKALKDCLVNITVDRHLGSELTLPFHYFSTYIPVRKGLAIEPVFCCQYFKCFGNSQFVHDMGWDDFVVEFTKRRNP